MVTPTDSLDFSTGDSRALLADGLAQMGLPNDSAFVNAAYEQWNRLRGNQAEFLLWLRGTQQYKDAYPYAEDLRRRGIPFSEAGALQYKNNVRQLLHSVGAPEGFVTEKYLNDLIAGNVSFNELQSRVANSYAEYLQAPPAVKEEFRNQIGDDGAILAFYLDPQHTIQQFGEIKAKALVRGFGKQFGLTVGAQAEQYAYGLSADQVQQGLAQVKELDPLTRRALGDTAATTDDELARMTFTGDTTEVRKLLEERGAAFSDAVGGGLGQQRTGFGAARGA